MQFTKECFYPWTFRIVHAGGMICPCCAMHDTDYGDYIIDYIMPKKRGEESGDIFNNDAIKELKRGLLTGALHPMCQKCALQPKKMIPVEIYKEKLEHLFEKSNVEYEKGSDYAEVNAIRQAGIGNTNKCNLRCIYCNQSVLADINPYFKMNFPEDELLECLEMLVEKGITSLETGVFGEATIHPKWREVFGVFHQRHPEISLLLTTNLSKHYTDEEIELLAEHICLRVSLETLDEELFSKIRVNGNLPLILGNLSRIEKVINQKGYAHSRIAISSVICNLTWKSIPEVSEFAFQHGFSYFATNFEPRANSIGIQEGILKPIEALEDNEKEEVRQILLQTKKRAEEYGAEFHTNAGLFERADINYNQFEECGKNPIYKAFIKKYPLGSPEMFLGVEYDYLYNQYAGIMLQNHQQLNLKLDSEDNTFEYRVIRVYKNGRVSEKYEQRVVPDYRKIMKTTDEFVYQVSWEDEDIQYILLQIINWWKE